MRSLRLLDKSRQLVKVLTEGEADTLIASGKAEYRKEGRREVVILLDNRVVRDFRRGSDQNTLGGPALQSVYREHHRGRTLTMQKRASEEIVSEDASQAETAKQLHKWDPHLTFDEVRAGQLVSQTTRDTRAEAKWRNANIVSYLAYEEYQRALKAA